MQRVTAYIDGFNLYFGLKHSAFKRYCWLDVAALAGSLLKPGQQLAATHYFSANIRSNGHNGADQKRQNDYLEALRVQGAQCQLGHYLEKQRRCRQCGHTWPDWEEKMTDVNIAIQLMTDAFNDAFDLARVISGDSDLTTPIRRVRERFSVKRVIVAFPPQRHSKALKQHANGHVAISENKLRASQLPDQLIKPDGFVIQRPAHWK